jgi:pimeloyl-ACP methyl ester carboxylesterase
MLRERIFKTGDVKLNYAEGPNNGPPMLFLHGLSARWQSFQDLALQYSGRWHVFALDLRGHGGSGHLADSYTWETFGDDTRIFLSEVVREPAVILGHSIGAMLAIYQASRSPGRVRGIILEDPSLFRYRRLRDWHSEVDLSATSEIAERCLSPEGIRAALAALDPRYTGPLIESRVASLSQLDAEALAMTVDASGTRSFQIEALRKVIASLAVASGEDLTRRGFLEQPAKRVVPRLGANRLRLRSSKCACSWQEP